MLSVSFNTMKTMPKTPANVIPWNITNPLLAFDTLQCFENGINVHIVSPKQTERRDKRDTLNRLVWLFGTGKATNPSIHYLLLQIV